MSDEFLVDVAIRGTFRIKAVNSPECARVRIALDDMAKRGVCGTFQIGGVTGVAALMADPIDQIQPWGADEKYPMVHFPKAKE